MTTSTDGKLCYGIKFDQGFAFPWRDNIDDWWREVNGFSDINEPYGQDGNLKPGVTYDSPTYKAYIQHIVDWSNANPIPVVLVNYCHCKHPMWILAVPSSYVRASRGYPEEIDFEKLKKSEEEKQTLIDFCNGYGIEMPHEPKWWLSGYWG